MCGVLASMSGGVLFMKDESIIALGRCACGTALLLTSMLTGINGMVQTISLILLGIPIELIKK